MTKKRVMIIAGEPSGDMQASHLVKSLRAINNHIEIFGVGGEKMKQSGVEIVYDIGGLAVVGFVEVIKHLRTFKKLFERLCSLLETKKPDAVVLVDYPGFNLRFARYAKSKNIPVIYYISPQVWAWGKDRLFEIKKYVDKMIVVFGFEEELYKDFGIKAGFVGHPFLDIVRPGRKKEELIRALHLSHHSAKISLFPGSREKEIECHLPVMLEACRLIKEKLPDAEFILSRCKEMDRAIYNKIISSSKIKPHSLENSPYDVMEISDMVIVSSGSATLETAIMEKPMVIIYKTSMITWLLARSMVKIPDIGLVNVVAGKRIVPELIQFDANAVKIAKECLEILNDKKRQENIKRELKKVKEKLGEQGAAERAAHIIQKFISSR